VGLAADGAGLDGRASPRAWGWGSPVDTTIAAVSWMIHQFEKHISMARQVEPTPAREIETDELVLCLVKQVGLFGCREPFTKEPHCLLVCLVLSLAYDGIDICRRHSAETRTFGYPDHSPRERVLALAAGS
jgi:hypothetical protein